MNFIEWQIVGNDLQFTGIHSAVRGDFSLDIDENTSICSYLYPAVTQSPNEDRMIIMLPGLSECMDDKKITLKTHQVQRVVEALEFTESFLKKKFS